MLGFPMVQRGAFTLVMVAAPILLLDPTFARSESRDAVRSAVVKVIVTFSAPDLQYPWQRARMMYGVGSGVILESGFIMTNAHVVANGVSIDVKREGGTERYQAEIAFISHAADLALLAVEDPRFVDGAGHLALGGMPRTQDRVEVFGYPEGGESLSITAGVVSRIEIGDYVHSGANLMLVQIDAAINPGNSGGPVVGGERIVGIATQGSSELQNTGYMVPLPVIRQFLKDVEDGRVDGPQMLGARLQDLESPAHRTRLGLAQHETGALVIAVNHGSPSWGTLERGDVILALDGRPIASDLSVASSFGPRMSWASLLAEKQAGDPLVLSVVRNGERIGKTVRLHTWQPLVPGPNVSDAARYRIFGGFVFQPLTMDYLNIDPDNADSALLSLRQYHNLRTPQRAEVIVLSKVLPGEASRGYFDCYDEIVERVQGQVPRDMAHLNELLDSARGRWLDIETAAHLRFVLDLDLARSETPKILAKFGIAADRSPGGEASIVGRMEP